ncbi:MAG TPA: peptidoglycan DD-metalloendopeptidase family protein [Polyangiaceae bacterium]
MASTPEPDSPKFVGRVVDPLARDDAGSQPDGTDIGLAPEPSAPGGETLHQDPAQRDPEDHPVRRRLLERAKAHRHEQAARGLDEFAPRPVPARTARELELERIARPASRPPSAPRSLSGRGQLSPGMLSLFGSLTGLATVFSLIALAMHIDARLDAVPAAPSSAPVPPASQSGAPPAPPRGAVQKKRTRRAGPWRIPRTPAAELKRIEGAVGREPFLSAIQAAGLEKSQAYRVLTALKELRDLDHCDKNDRFVALVERASGRVTAFEYVVSREEVYQARHDDNGLLKGERLDLEVEHEQVKGALAFDGASFDAVAKRFGFGPGLARVLGKALDGHTSLDEIESGDRFRVVVQEVTVLGEFARYSGVEALEYMPARGKRLRIYYLQHPVAGGYFNDKGRAPYQGGWRKPIPDAPITSRFNPKRMHPVLKKVMPHNGTDFGAPAGTPVGASSYGTVSFIGYSGPSGNLVLIDHPGWIETGYAHLSRFAEGLKVGDKVKRLQLVGYVGSTGRSTGPHLHFSAKKEGRFIDAETLNLDGMRVLPMDLRPAFEKIRTAYDALLDAVPLPEATQPKSVATEVAAATEPDPGAEADDAADEDTPEPLAEVEAAAKVAPPRAEKSKAAPGGPPATSQGASAIYLTDEELLKLQPATDDGEVSE